VQELDLSILDEDPPAGMVVVEDEERGIKHLVLNCDDSILIFAQRILDVPTLPGALFRRLLQRNRTRVYGAFVLGLMLDSGVLHTLYKT
jgi:hypothetical protein